MLTENHKKNQMGAVLMFFMCFSESGDFLDSIVTGDETWVFHHTSENKHQLMEWRHTHSPTKNKFKTSTPTNKIMSCLWGPKGVLMVDFVCHETTF